MPHVRCHLSEIGQPETISLTINNRNHKSIEKLPNQIYFSQSIDIIQLSVGQKVESDHASISFVTEQHSHPTANTAVEISGDQNHGYIDAGDHSHNLVLRGVNSNTTKVEMLELDTSDDDNQKVIFTQGQIQLGSKVKYHSVDAYHNSSNSELVVFESDVTTSYGFKAQIVVLRDTSASTADDDKHFSEINVIATGSTAAFSEYGVVTSTGNLYSLATDVTSGNKLRLKVSLVHSGDHEIRANIIEFLH